MSKFLDRFRYFKQRGETFSGDHGQELNVNRDWEDGYRSRWQHDKVVRSTHGVNCTGSCSWKIYVKNGLVTWETQQTDYPRTAARLSAWCQLFLVSVQRKPREISDGAQAPDQTVA